jgi:pimeloyl-ACP methyl ester carboxylesterase
VNEAALHVVEGGDPTRPSILFLHGWPESWQAWERVMQLGSEQAHVVAIDLPGVGQSTGATTDGSKRELAGTVHQLISTMKLADVTLVGHDIGGMVAYSYLRAYSDIKRAVIMDVVIPGVKPWEAVLRNPYLWHFAFHAVPNLPESLIQGHQRIYFDFFYDALSADPTKIAPEVREAYASAYSTLSALTAGFRWYRTFPDDAKANQETAAQANVATPLLYVRGERETGAIDDYVNGLRDAGVVNVQPTLIPGAGHFTQEEAPAEVWQVLARFCGI